MCFKVKKKKLEKPKQNNPLNQENVVNFLLEKKKKDILL